MITVNTETMANAIRALAMDAIQKAKSGHPGMPMGMAEIAVALWTRHLRYNPADPEWPGRDRFVLSNGHGSMLLYSVLHLTGYDLSMEDIKSFRQWGSKTPGHPEFGVTPGVETTTGPLGQGFANAVGMALAEKLLAAEFNRPGFPVVDNHTYVFCGDGCLMEGVSHEAASLAGVWKLNKLVALYDDNGISIDGEVTAWFSDDTRKRFESCGWNVIGPVDGHDVGAVDAAIAQARASQERPTLIICKTVIGKGSPNRQGKSKSHGEALGEAEVALTREAIGWKEPPFVVPQEVYDAWDHRKEGAAADAAWREMFAGYEKAYPAEAAELRRRWAGELPADFDAAVDAAIEEAAGKAESVATRKASLAALNALAPKLPELLGGSADLTGSNLTMWKGAAAMRPDNLLGRHINYGVREFGMAGIMNGVALYGGFIPYGATFLTFSDYARNAMRMAALMKIRSIFVYTHDSIGVGEDGPTHQPIEHVCSLRLIPGLDVWRPADTVESLVAWSAALSNKHAPAVLVFSRQTVPFPDRDEFDIDAVERGGYVLLEAPGGRERARAAIVATGSELPLAVEARKTLAALNIPVRVVSMPCESVFDRQDAAWRESVLPEGLPVVTVEAGVTGFWQKYVRGNGHSLGIDTFGASAPGGELFKRFGLTVENVVSIVQQVVER